MGQLDDRSAAKDQEAIADAKLIGHWDDAVDAARAAQGRCGIITNPCSTYPHPCVLPRCHLGPCDSRPPEMRSAAQTAPPERFLMRLIGGPHASDRIATSDVLPWPLPDKLPDPEGRGFYVKQGESELPPQQPDSHVMRGAEYIWEGADGDVVLCGAIGCSNPATHTWSGHPTCDDCATPMRKAARGS